MALLEEGVTEEIQMLGKKVIYAREFKGKSIIVSDMVKFFSNLSDLNNHPSTKALFMKKQVGIQFLHLVTAILNKNNEAIQVNPALKSLKDILDMKLEKQAQI